MGLCGESASVAFPWGWLDMKINKFVMSASFLKNSALASLSCKHQNKIRLRRGNKSITKENHETLPKIMTLT